METKLREHYTLLIPGLHLWVSLGCSPEERFKPQLVEIDILIRFVEQPLGCQSDKLSDVCCYDTIVKELIASTKHQSFHLIEFLAARIFDLVAAQLYRKSSDALHAEKFQSSLDLNDCQERGRLACGINTKETEIEVTITKPNHRVSQVQKGMVFTYCKTLK